MTLLPIVGRELRMASRRAGTYWLRCFAAAGALALGCITFLWSASVGPGQMGLHVFTALSVVAFGFSLLAGVLMTADCLSQEKREGTLGLLFLTDLKAYDVVLGKLAATSLHAIFGLVAIFPVLGLPMVLGGVTGREFGRLLLVFGGTLFFSLNLGMLISAHSGSSRQAFTRGFLCVAAFTAVFPLLQWSLEVWSKTTRAEFLSWPSPACAFVNAFETNYAAPRGPLNFWMSLTLILLAGIASLAWTNFAVPRSWREKDEATREGRNNHKNAGAVRGKVYRENPVYWLAMGDGTGGSHVNRTLFWAVPIWFLFLAGAVFSRLNIQSFVVCLCISYVLHVWVKIVLVTEASQRMFQERQSGALELLLVTPISAREIVAGQSRALKTHFHRAFITLCAVNFLMAWVVMIFGRLLKLRLEDQLCFVSIFAGGALLLWLDFRALALVGMWRGLTMRHAHRAIMGALGQVMGIPWLVIFFFASTLGTSITSPGDVGVMLATWVIFGILINSNAIHNVRKKLENEFRPAAARRF
jgi:ABC-type transport system involved in multi-copper enzyme maturation permease subunit